MITNIGQVLTGESERTVVIRVTHVNDRALQESYLAAKELFGGTAYLVFTWNDKFDPRYAFSDTLI